MHRVISNITTFLLATLLSFACTTPTTEVANAPTATRAIASSTPLSANIQPATLFPNPTVTVTLEGTIAPTPSSLPVFDPTIPRDIITATNADQVKLLAEIILEGIITGVAWSPSGDVLAVSAERHVMFFNMDDFYATPHIVEGAAPDCEFHPDGSLLATSSGMRDIVTGEWEHVFSLPYDCQGAGCCGIQGMGLSPDGNLLATTEYTCMRVRIWDTKTGENLWTLDGEDVGMVPGGGGAIYDATFNPEGTAVLFGHSESMAIGHRLYLWYFESGEIVDFEPAPRPDGKTVDGTVLGVSFNLDGTLIASTGWDGVVRIWDVATRSELFAIQGYSSRSEAVDFSPDGTILASTGYMGPIYLLNVADGETMNTLSAPTVTPSYISFSPDGTLLASGEMTSYTQGLLKLWGIPQD